jgi:hypothetical protein
MQYMDPETEEERRKISDRRATIAARKRIKQRKTKRLIWVVSLIVLGGILYYVGSTTPAIHDPIAQWMSGQEQAAIQNTSGIRKTIKGENKRRRLVDVNGETSLDNELP